MHSITPRRPVAHLVAPRRSPQAAAEAIERIAPLPTGSDERFVGYGVIGLTWSSGHVLGLRRWPASSVGPAYTSVWHRTPDRVWRLYSDVAEHFSCSRYIGRMVTETATSGIRLTWLTPWTLRVDVAAAALTWEMEFTSTVATAMFGLARHWVSEPAASSDIALQLLQWAAPHFLRSGPLRLMGLMPNGQRFRVTPRRVWMVRASQAAFAGASLGRPERLADEVRLGDFIVPQSGILAFATARFR